MYYRSAENYLEMTGVENTIPAMTYETQDDVLAYKSYLRRHYDKQNRGANWSRDSERQKTYSAEWAFERAYYAINPPKVTTLADAQNLVRRVVKSKHYAVNAKNPKKSPKVGVKHYRRYGGKTDGFNIWLKETSINEYLVLHELAHTMGHMHHGRSFRQCVIGLVSRFIGAEAAKMLKKEFKERKLAFGDARKPQTFDKWLESRNRMKKIRAKSPVGVS